jgi:phytoene dehydrogenase-like protein
MQTDRKIVIIGAGLSGYSAAARLMDNGYTNIIILEASNRTGGRIYTIDYGNAGQKLDLGAQWIHGQKGNVIWEIVNKHVELGSTPFDDVDGTFLLSNGTLPNQNQCLKLQTLIEELTEESWSSVKKFNGSFGEFIIDRYTKALETAAFRGIKKDIAKMMLDDAQKQVNGFYASATWLDISGKLYTNYDDTEGDQDVTWKAKGYATVFDFITVKKLFLKK